MFSQLGQLFSFGHDKKYRPTQFVIFQMLLLELLFEQKNRSTAFAEIMANKPDDKPFFEEDILGSSGKYKCQWHLGYTRVTGNPNGITGFARVLASTDASIPNGKVRRFHLCANKPCTANWPPGKHGVYGEPIHVQRIDEPPELAAFAEAPPTPPFVPP